MNRSTPILSSRSLWLLTAGGFYAFFVFGFVDNLKGPTLPAVLRDLELSYGQGGTILLAGYLGFMVATLATGVLADAAGNKTVLVLAGLCLTVGVGAFSLGNSFWMLALAMLVTGLGMGAIEVGGNGLIVELHSRQRGRYLNLLAVFHGVGSLAVPLYAAYLLADGVAWRQVFQFTLLLTAALGIFFLLVKYPDVKPAGGGNVKLRTLIDAALTREMGLYYLLIAVYVAAELGVAAWLVVFLEEVKGFGVGVGALYLSLFFAAIMVGRLVGSFVVDRIGYLPALLAAGSAAIVCLIIGIFGPATLTFFLPLTGLFFSIIFPTTTAAVSGLHVANMGAILGVLFAFGGVGGALGPWLIGVTADLVGIELAFALNIGYSAAVVVVLLLLRR